MKWILLHYCILFYFTGDQCEEVLPSRECICPAPQVCVPHPSPPGFTCQPSQSCLHNHSCHASITPDAFSIAPEEIVGICVSVVVVISLIGLFILYRFVLALFQYLSNMTYIKILYIAGDKNNQRLLICYLFTLDMF